MNIKNVYLTLAFMAMGLLSSNGASSCKSSSDISSNDIKSVENVSNNESASKIDQIKEAGYVVDSYKTKNGKNVNIAFIKHASLIFEIDGKVIYIDPTAMFGNDFSILPKADYIFVTHEHHDHYDPETIKTISKDDTRLITNGRVAELNKSGEALSPGDKIEIEGIEITATPAYNITQDHLQYHPKERKDVGFIYDIDGLRIYVAGDTEDIEDMKEMKDIDIAFLPVNQPFTMTPQQAIHAIEMLSPRIVYPYHYGQTDLFSIEEKYQNSPISVLIRNMQ